MRTKVPDCSASALPRVQASSAAHHDGPVPHHCMLPDSRWPRLPGNERHDKWVRACVQGTNTTAYSCGCPRFQNTPRTASDGARANLLPRHAAGSGALDVAPCSPQLGHQVCLPHDAWVQNTGELRTACSIRRHSLPQIQNLISPDLVF